MKTNMRRRGPAWTVAAALLAAAAGLIDGSSARSQPLRQALDEVTEKGLAAGLTPGLSIAVVEGDRVLWKRSSGLADLGTGRPVTEETMFYLASTSKALTALCTAVLAERGALSLDDPLSRFFRDVRLAEGLSADSIRMRDLLTHTHGIDPMGPVSLRVAFTGDYTNQQLLDLLPAHRAAKRGRTFQYSNLGYDLAALALSPSSKGGWKDVVAREVTEPLGMRLTTSSVSRVPEERLAQPHELGPAGFERIPLAKEDANMGPAGGHFAAAGDLARLLLAELNGGQVDGVAVLSPEAIAETQRLQVAQDRDFAGYHRHGWGLGWDLGTYEGDTLIHRFGGFSGYRCHVSFMPRHRIGIVILMNGGDASGSLIDVMATGIYDHMLGRPDAAGRYLERLAPLAAKREELMRNAAAKVASRASSPAFPRPASAYAGRYENKLFGTLELREEAGRLQASLGVARSPVEVADAEKNQLEVALLGRSMVVTVSFPEAGGSADSVEFLGSWFLRTQPGEE